MVSAKEKKVRGPTKMSSIWHGDKEVKIHVKVNKYGQPCGVKTSNFTNFIATLVKGGHITLTQKDWRVVPGKDIIWKTVTVIIFPLCSILLLMCRHEILFLYVLGGIY